MGYSVVDGRLLGSVSILPRIRDLGIASGSPYKFEYHLCGPDSCFFLLAPHSHSHSSIVGPRCLRSRSLSSALAHPPSRSSLSLLLSLLVADNPPAEGLGAPGRPPAAEAGRWPCCRGCCPWGVALPGEGHGYHHLVGSSVVVGPSFRSFLLFCFFFFYSLLDGKEGRITRQLPSSTKSVYLSLRLQIRR